MSHKKAQQVIGQCIRHFREQRKLTLEGLAAAAGITYQYLSGIENGKENFSISVLEELAAALQISINTLITLAYEPEANPNIVQIQSAYFRPQVPLPPNLTIEHLEAAANQTIVIIHQLNQNLLRETAKPLHKYIQGNNFSGLISNVFTYAMNDNSPYKHNHEQRYPDLVNKMANNEGLEIKATKNLGKGGESHNGHSGWHSIVCYDLTELGDIIFLHIMFAYLNGHQHKETDWNYLGSQVNKETGSRRTETYITNIYGTTKLRDGSVYLDPNRVNYSRWQHKRRIAEIPHYSIFYQPN